MFCATVCECSILRRSRTRRSLLLLGFDPRPLARVLHSNKTHIYKSRERERVRARLFPAKGCGEWFRFAGVAPKSATLDLDIIKYTAARATDIT